MTTVRQFKKEHPELKGIKFILCEHLKTKKIDEVSYNIFVGDSTRVLLCPVCHKIVIGDASDHLMRTTITLLRVIDLNKSVEYEHWLKTGA